MFCQRTTLPPPFGSKKAPPKLRSMKSMVSAAARTGVARSCKTAVVRIAQQKTGMRNIVIPGARMRNIVTRKLAAPMVEEIPRMATRRSRRSMPTPVWRGGAGCRQSTGVAEPPKRSRRT